jgi:hypothetical protein
MVYLLVYFLFKISPRGYKTFQKEIYQKMHRDQGYNKSKIQVGVSYFDYTFVQNTKNGWPKLYPYCLCSDPFFIQKSIQKVIE